jgi:hypothetical protein
MIRGVGPYSALITPKAGSLFHAVFHLVPQKPFIRPAGMLCGVSSSCPLHSALRASRVGDTSPAACCPAGKAGKASPFNKGEDP